MPDISTINGVDITTLASFGGVAFADGQTVDGQNVALASDAHELISTSGAISAGTSSVSFSTAYSKYDVEEYHFINLVPSNNGEQLTFQVKRSGSSTYNVPMTATYWLHYNRSGSTSYFYASAYDQNNGTSYQRLNNFSRAAVSGTSYGSSGILKVYGAYGGLNRVKHFQSRISNTYYTLGAYDQHVAGYFNETNFLTGIDFKFSSGTIASGEIRRYGVLNS